eukprot:2771381-Pyramimonas_sp.AAC.1
MLLLRILMLLILIMRSFFHRDRRHSHVPVASASPSLRVGSVDFHRSTRLCLLLPSSAPTSTVIPHATPPDIRHACELWALAGRRARVGAIVRDAVKA